MNTNTSFPKEKIKILMLEGVHRAALQLFKDHGYSDIEVVKGAMSEEDLCAKIKDVHLLGIRCHLQRKFFYQSRTVVQSSGFW